MNRIPKNSIQFIQPSLSTLLIGKVVSLEFKNDGIKPKVNSFKFEVLGFPVSHNQDEELNKLQLETNSDFPIHLWHWGMPENCKSNYPPNLDEFDYIFYFNYVLAFWHSQSQKTRFLNLLKAKKPIIIERIDSDKFIIKKQKNMKIQDNSITLIDFAGGDASFCLSAWQSTGLELNIDLKKLPVKDRIPVLFEATQKMKQKTAKELLKMLLSEGHHTPFEKSYLHFSVTAEIASHIHFLKHRIGVSINSESARYKELNQDKAYIPRDFSSENKERLWRHIEESFKLYHYLIKSQTAFLIEQGQSPADARKRAKESSRFCLPYATQLNFDVAFNMRSFFHFLKLRKSPKAQIEIREIAEAMYQAVKSKTDGAFDLTLSIIDKII